MTILLVIFFPGAMFLVLDLKRSRTLQNLIMERTVLDPAVGARLMEPLQMTTSPIVRVTLTGTRTLGQEFGKLSRYTQIEDVLTFFFSQLWHYVNVSVRVVL